MKPEENTIPESTFKTFFTKHNNFHTYGFKEWVFYPGMLFQDMEAWWTDNGLRPTPHEGIDLCFYRDNAGKVRRIDNGTKIPVMYTGDIVHTHDDFLGKSIYVKHRIKDKSGNALYTIYGHTTPRNHYLTGKKVREGDIIAEVAALPENSKIFPHIHITIAWIHKSLPCKKLDWNTIWNSRLVTLCNPLEHIDAKLEVS
jgi:Peptidase family M23.